MKHQQKIGMPYRESEEYVSRLVTRMTEQAVSEKTRAKMRPIRRIMTAAAVVVVLLAGAGVTYYKLGNVSEPLVSDSQSPVDEFLDCLTDKEIQMLVYYELEEIEY